MNWLFRTDLPTYRGLNVDNVHSIVRNHPRCNYVSRSELNRLIKLGDTADWETELKPILYNIAYALYGPEEVEPNLTRVYED